MAISRREFVAGAGAGAACLALGGAGTASAAEPGQKRVTLLHVTDTHAQLETHPEYLPGEKPSNRMMGGYARLKVGWVTGAELKKYLENEGPRASGLVMTYAASAAPGRRLKSVKVAGKEVEDDGRYTMAGCERDGESIDVVCRHPGTHDVKVLPERLRAMLLGYCKKHPVLSPKREGRAVAVDLPKSVFSQDQILPRKPCR